MNTTTPEGGVVIARVDAAAFFIRPEAYREQVRAWLRANGVDPNDVTLNRDVQVVLLDGPAIAREELIRDPATGSMQLGPPDADGDRRVLARVVTHDRRPARGNGGGGVPR